MLSRHIPTCPPIRERRALRNIGNFVHRIQFPVFIRRHRPHKMPRHSQRPLRPVALHAVLVPREFRLPHLLLLDAVKHPALLRIHRRHLHQRSARDIADVNLVVEIQRTRIRRRNQLSLKRTFRKHQHLRRLRNPKRIENSRQVTKLVIPSQLHLPRIQSALQSRHRIIRRRLRVSDRLLIVFELLPRALKVFRPRTRRQQDRQRRREIKAISNHEASFTPTLANQATQILRNTAHSLQSAGLNESDKSPAHFASDSAGLSN